jgi:hypothetical protein
MKRAFNALAAPVAASALLAGCMPPPEKPAPTQRQESLESTLRPAVRKITEMALGNVVVSAEQERAQRAKKDPVFVKVIDPNHQDEALLTYSFIRGDKKKTSEREGSINTVQIRGDNTSDGVLPDQIRSVTITRDSDCNTKQVCLRSQKVEILAPHTSSNATGLWVGMSSDLTRSKSDHQNGAEVIDTISNPITPLSVDDASSAEITGANIADAALHLYDAATSAPEGY